MTKLKPKLAKQKEMNDRDKRNVLIIIDVLIVLYFFSSWFRNSAFGPQLTYYIFSPIFLIGVLHFVFSQFKSK